MKRTGRLKTYAPLERHTPLRQVSLRRLALETPAGGGNGPTPARGLNRSMATGRAATALSRPRPTGPDRNTVDAVLERDQYSCTWCGGDLHGERGWDWSIQHRRPRRMGGDERPDTNSPSNLVAVHGSGTTGCHGHIESERSKAYARGFSLHADEVPAERELKHAIHGWVLLTDDGGMRPIKD